jgi:hypothetical protein
MTSANRLPSASGSGQPWTPGTQAAGVKCPACGLANEPGARTCRNCGLPIAGSGDPVRGVAPGRVDLPKVQRSGVSATVGFVIVIALLLVGGTLAVSGGGGLLSGGGRFFGAEPSPSPTPATVRVDGSEIVGDPGDGTETGEEDLPKPKGTKFDYTCGNNAIKDLSRGKWFLIDVQAGLRTADNGDLYDQVYWRLSRTNNKKQKSPTTVSMIWSTPKELQERFDIGRVGGDRAILVTFNGPVQLDTNQTLERGQFEDEGIDQVRRVQLFERNGKVRTVIGVSEDSCARMRANGWGRKATGQKAARVVLDLERVYEGS